MDTYSLYLRAVRRSYSVRLLELLDGLDTGQSLVSCIDNQALDFWTSMYSLSISQTYPTPFP